MTVSVAIPTLMTGRLTLRAPKTEDRDRFVEYFAHESSWFTGGPLDEHDAWRRLLVIAGQWVVRGAGLFIVADRKTDLCLGTCGAFLPPDWPEREIGWWLLPDARGRGIMTEAAIEVRAHFYRQEWQTAVSYIHPDNDASKAVARRLGAAYEETIELRGEDHEVWRHPSPARLGLAA